MLFRSVGSSVAIPNVNAIFPVAGEEYMLVTSVDFVNGLGFSGLMLDRGEFPKAITDFLFFSINEFPPFAGPNVATGFGYSNYYKCIVGSFLSYGGNYSGGQTPVALTLSKKPCFTVV